MIQGIKQPGKNALSVEDKVYIEKNYKTFSDTLLSYQTGVSISTIYRYRKLKGLEKTGYSPQTLRNN